MSVTSVLNATGGVAGAVPDNPNTMTSTDFMHLLVTELQNQDPLEPMSTTEMSNQLSQMTMNEQLTEMAATMKENLLMNQSINNTGMLALVGQNVTVAGDEVHVADGEVSGTMINAAGPGTAEVVVLDENGAVVARYTETVDAGLNNVGWDGRGLDGEPVADGEYTVEVTVTDADGNDVTSEVLMTGPVQGLRYEQGMAVVNVFGTEFFVSEIYQVS
ncbi:MAG: flagellar hook capping FlgD N-terminal domain-containing protein [Candidatus Krumholzibacteriia bacterium]